MPKPSEAPTVWYSSGVTISDGNYGSVRVDFGASFPVPADEDLEDTMERCFNFVEDELQARVDEVKRSLK